MLPVNLQTFVPTYGPTIGYILIGAIVFAETGLFIGFFLPGDSLLFTAGFLASQHFLDIWIVSILCAVMAVLGDTTGYTIGRVIGPRLFIREDSLLFKKKHLVTAHEFYERHGGKAILFAQFMPIVRTFSPVVAGIAAMPYPAFATFNVVAALLWGLGVPWAGYFLGQVPLVRDHLEPVILLIVVVSIAPSAIHVWRENGSEIMAWLRTRLNGRSATEKDVAQGR